MSHFYRRGQLSLVMTLVVVLSSLLGGGQRVARTTAQGAAGGARPLVIYPGRNDTSPALRDVAPLRTPAPQAGEAARELPLGRRPSPQKERADAGAATSPDPALQRAPDAARMPAVGLSFEGVGNVQNVLPPDTVGDVGTQHYVQMVNSSFAIWDKSGTLLYGPADNNTLWAGFGGPCESTNDGDPIVLYDHLADRWLLTQFALPNFPNGPFFQCIALSQSGDPTGAYYRYEYQLSATKLNDYPKFGVWPDGYYMSVNQFEAPFFGYAGAGVGAFDRISMLSGAPAPLVFFDLQSVDPNLFGLLPADLDGPPPPVGTPNYFAAVDEDGFGYPQDQLELWRFAVDWANPAASAFSGPELLATAPFDSNMCDYARDCVPQQGTAARLDAISDRLMFRLQYRNFGTHEALVVNHTVDAGNNRAGVRWYELRLNGGIPTIYQQGTYAPADGLNRWMGSIAMDGGGNLALGYSASGSTSYPSMRYAGRLAGDPLDTLPQAEATLIAGGGAQTSLASRWGDYSTMSVDPIDDCTFWFTSEYYPTTAEADWHTRVGSFSFPSCTPLPSGALRGSVTDATTGTALPGASVAADSFSTITDASGAYRFTSLPTGSYTVTASLYGYNPQTVTDLAVSENITTTQDFQLVAAPQAIVQGTVTDALQGWPLYARVQINAEGLSQTLFTDPLTGVFSTTLAAGSPHSFTASAPGYTETTLVVTPPEGTSTLAITLEADPITCAAPGYTAVPLAEEGFEGSFPPPGWGVYETGDTSGPGWQQGQIGSLGSHNEPHSGTFYAWNDDDQLPASAVNWLTVPQITVPAGGATLAFWQSVFFASFYDYHGVLVTTSANPDPAVATYTEIYSGTASEAWSRQVLDLSAYAGQSIHLAFRYEGDFADEWYLDDLLLATCTPQAGGLLVGHVYDGNTGAPINGATVQRDGSNEATTSFATPDDPAQDDGLYVLFSSALGSSSFSATGAPGYGTASATATITAGGVTAQDFLLPAGLLRALPDSVSVTTAPDGVLTRTLTLSNSGTLSATFSLREVENAAIVLGPTAGEGVWLGPPGKRFNNAARGGTARTFPRAYRWTPNTPSAPLRVLLYADDFVHVAPDTLPDQALRRLGLGYTAHYDGDWDGFLADLNNGGPWDMVLVSGENFVPPAATLNAVLDVLNSYATGGGRLVFTFWALGAVPNHPLFDTLGITYVNDDTDAPDPVYWWQPEHPAFSDPERVPELTTPQPSIAPYGQYVEPAAGALALGGFTTAPAVNNAALVLANGGRTLFKGFTDVQHSADSDNDSMLDGAELWANLIDGVQNRFSEDIPWLSVAPRDGELAAGQAAEVELRFDATGLSTGVYTGQLRLRNDTPYGTSSISVSLEVRNFGVLVTPAEAAQAGTPGTSVTYTLRLTNTGTLSDTYELAADGNSWTTLVSPTIGPLDPGVAVEATALVQIPADATLDDSDAATITIRSRGDPVISTTVRLSTTVESLVSFLAVASDAGALGVQGRTVRYMLTITNAGNRNDSYTLSASGNAWSASFAGTSATLAPGASTSLPVDVTVPPTAALGAHDTLTLTIRSRSDPSRTRTLVLTTTVAGAVTYIPLVAR